MSINILSFDTSTDLCSVALYFNKNIYFKYNLSPNSHMKYILQIINDLLLNANTDLSKINVISCSCGPGNFTGIRISIGVAQSISFAKNIPLISISTLEILAQGAWRKLKSHKVLSAIDAKSKQIYFAKYIRSKKGIWFILDKKEKIISLKNLIKIKTNIKKNWDISGNAWKNYEKYFLKNKNFLKNKIIFPSAIDMIPLTINYWKKNKISSLNKIKPIYLNKKYL
ncbi:tRNA (adenosine(37)-N6)-threonylcarbamoyltransferase complex dimerization subunit type 1 TsaB [Sodalis-like secondary symbiont of Drepanosiphum platanoidis]|uniref:tRNA (adenosine(37)-N6)-threonylcarbamoyltransferase complex dimerization subunit type 1 TsaB n=1 Tax=Sodalis-like secondary symbiont of Drepanosiphum platanoidis TaxID=2994493 RepID=UPI003464722F